MVSTEYPHGYVPVRSKLEHRSRETPEAFEFLENVCSIPPLTWSKSCSNAPPPPPPSPHRVEKLFNHTQYRKDHRLFPTFVIYSIFSNRNQISLFLNKVYDKLIAMTRKKVGVPMLVGAL